MQEYYLNWTQSPFCVGDIFMIIFLMVYMVYIVNKLLALLEKEFERSGL
jgi:hypothetical protein